MAPEWITYYNNLFITNEKRSLGGAWRPGTHVTPIQEVGGFVVGFVERFHHFGIQNLLNPL